MCLTLLLRADGVVPSALRCVFAGHAGVYSCAPPCPVAELPVELVASYEPPSALCSPAAAAGSPGAAWIHREH